MLWKRATRPAKASSASKRVRSSNACQATSTGTVSASGAYADLTDLKNNITESRNTVLVVGYMAKDTLGKKIVDKEKIVKIYGLEYELNAEVVVINALSGHADRGDLLNYARESAPANGIYLVHGDEEQTKSLYDLLTAEGMKAAMPVKDEEVML